MKKRLASLVIIVVLLISYSCTAMANPILVSQEVLRTCGKPLMEIADKELFENICEKSKIFDSLHCRYTRIAKLICNGHTNKQISQICGIPVGTVKKYIDTLLKYFETRQEICASYTARLIYKSCK